MRTTEAGKLLDGTSRLQAANQSRHQDGGDDGAANPRSPIELSELIDYNRAVLDQALTVIAAHEASPQADFAQHSGPHLRHVVEHYEALLEHLHERRIDYDDRRRDPQVQRSPRFARMRLQQLSAQLASLRIEWLRDPLTIRLRGGLDGETVFASQSTIARELLFVASHAVHHYAMIQLYCAQDGIDLGRDFGKAPSTRHHERPPSH